MRYKLADLCDIKIGRTPPRKEPQWFNTGLISDYTWVSIKDLGECNKYIDFSSETISLVGQEKFNIPVVKAGTIIMSFKLTVGRLAIVKKNLLTNEAIAQLPIKDPSKVDRDFLYYYLLTYPWNILGSTSSIATAINSKMIKQMEVELPDILIQRKIANILSIVDEKININHAINNNLLEQAITLYSEQFAELDKNGCIGDYCSVKSGFAFKSSWWASSGVKVIKIASINQDNLNLLECSYVDEDKIDKAKDFRVTAGDLLIAMTGATIGKFAMVPYSSETLLVNQRVGKFFLGDNPIEKLPFIYCTLKQPDVYYEVVNRGQGSAQPNISAFDIMNIPCVIPPNEVLGAFNKTAQPLFYLIISNQLENQRLSALRDALLPKLMSGELDVSDIEI